MKRILLNCLLIVLTIQVADAQYRTERSGYDGDYFSLEGTLELFQASRDMSVFERKLNTQNQWVNNLDLNYDGQIDYIRVEHRRKGDFHVIILQALVDRYAVQDVAVIEIEQIGRREAILQIVGDEDLYGQEVVVEPITGYADSRGGYHSEYGDFVNVYYWSSVQNILRPNYSVYASPYRWQSYPIGWSSWRPLSWNIYRPRVLVYNNRFRIANRHRVLSVHNFYRPYRSYCNTVVIRSNRVRVQQGRNPIYRPRRNQGNSYSYQGERPNGRLNAQTGNRSLNTDRRTTPDIRTAPGRGTNQGRSNNSRLNTPTGQAASRTGVIRPGRTGDQSSNRARTAAPLSKRSERSNQPSYNSSQRNTNTRVGSSSSVRTENRTPERVRSNDPVRSRTQYQQKSTRTSAPSNNSSVRQTTKRTVSTNRSVSTGSRSRSVSPQRQNTSRSTNTRTSPRSINKTPASSKRQVVPSTQRSTLKSKASTRSREGQSTRRKNDQ